MCCTCQEAIVEGACACPPDYLLYAIDHLISEGGGWAAIKDCPGGYEFIWDLVERGFLEEDGEYIRRLR
jgi:hypothetical protein